MKTESKLKIFVFLFLFLVIPLVSATINECDSLIWLGETCRITTPAGSPDCTSLDIVLSDGTLDVDDGATTELLGTTGIYYYDYTPASSGSFTVYCPDNTSAGFKVYDSGFATQQNISDSTFNITTTIYSQTDIITGSEENRIFMVVLLVCLVLYFLGLKTSDPTFHMVMGFILMVLGVYLIQYGFVGFDNALVTQAVTLILIALGGYFVVRTGMEWAMEGW